MSTKCLKILDAPKRDFSELKFFQSDEKKMATLLMMHVIFQVCSNDFNIFILLGYTETGIFRHLGTHVFRSL